MITNFSLSFNPKGLFHTNGFCRCGTLQRQPPGTGEHQRLGAVSAAGSLSQHPLRYLSQVSAPVSLDDGGRQKESSICSFDEKSNKKKETKFWIHSLTLKFKYVCLLYRDIQN